MAMKANAIHVKNYFGYEKSTDFAGAWKACSPADKAELLAGLQGEIDAGRYVPTVQESTLA